jgi:hypothetical protein
MKPEQVKALREPFPASQVGKLPKGGVTLDYVGHGAVTDRLLAVDPEWNWEPLSVDEQGFPELDSAGNLWIRLTVCGVTRLGVGDGPTMKVLIGDALRNAAMRFGVALDLWIRGHAEDDEKVAANEPQQQRRQRPRSMSPKPAGPHTHEAIRNMIDALSEEQRADFVGWYRANKYPVIKGQDSLEDHEAQAVMGKLDTYPSGDGLPAGEAPKGAEAPVADKRALGAVKPSDAAREALAGKS